MSDQTPEPTPLPPRMSSLYSDATTNIANLKKQQWQFVNYGLTLMAAVVALSRGWILPNWGSGVLASLLTIIVIAGGFVILDAQRAPQKHRRRLGLIYKRYFTPEEQCMFALKPLRDDLYGRHYSVLFFLVLVIAAMIAGVALYAPHSAR